MKQTPLVVRLDEMTLELDPSTLEITLWTGAALWSSLPGWEPGFELPDGQRLPFAAAARVTHTRQTTGLGPGIRSRFEGFTGEPDLGIETTLWLDGEGLRAELTPLGDPAGRVKAILWPAPFAFEQMDDASYTVLPYRQGLLLPNPWTRDMSRDIQYYGYYGYMPFFGQVRDGQGCIAITDTPYDAGCRLDAGAAAPKHVSPLWLPSLGQVRYRRSVRYRFLTGDYNDLCGVYRRYVADRGRLATLTQKAVRLPRVHNLIGSPIVHEGICTHIVPESRYYNAEDPSKNDSVVAFETRRQQLTALKEKWGFSKIYFHMDGWGVRGYDNLHPDYLPPCAAAGGWEGMARLSDTMADLGYLFATHDQYRDYYYDAPTFSLDSAVQNPDGSYPGNSLWAGGKQAALCATQAPDYVRRNFNALAAHGISLQGTYLDCFTCDPPNECANPRHPMTRGECIGYWQQCLEYCMNRGILPSSEEANDWAVPHMTHCHYAPYATDGEGAALGIPVPLYGLVYHDCLITPWHTLSVPAGQDPMLHALLSAGPLYLPIEPTPEQVERCRVTAALQEKCACAAMVRHRRLMDGREQTEFSNGVTVTVDFSAGTYDIAGL